MTTRQAVAEFGAIQKALAGASVAIYESDGNGISTGVLATLYQDVTGNGTRSNPQTLDDDGKLADPVYVDTAVVAAISNITVATERALRKIRVNPLQYPLPQTSANVNTGITAADVLTTAANVALTAADVITTGENVDLTAADVVQTGLDAAATAADVVQTGIDAAATAADVIQTAADVISTGNSETNAAASAVAAAASAAQGMYQNVESMDFSDSPIAPLLAEEGTLFKIDTSSGNVVVNLDELSNYGEDMKFAFVKSTNDANTVTINRGGASDTINGATSQVIDQQYVVYTLVGDTETGEWVMLIQNAAISDDAVTNAKLANMAQSTIKGRAAGSGTGDPVDLTPSQARTVMELGAAAQADLIDDDTFATATATNIPSAESVKAYVDANAGGGGYLHVRDEKSAGTDGGTSSSTTEHTRVLNTVSTNTITGASLATNQITLPTGTYRIKSSAPAVSGAASNKHKALLYNVTDSAVEITGTSENISATSNGIEQSRSFVNGQFTIAEEKVFELRHYITSGKSGTDGLGMSTNAGYTEVYAEVEIWEV